MAYSHLLDIPVVVGNDNSATTAGADTTGATFIALAVTSYAAVGVPTVTDSYGNTWTNQTGLDGGVFGGPADTYIFYCKNPTVGAGHTFNNALTGGFPSIGAVCFSGTPGATVFDQQAGNGTGGTSGQPEFGLTPSEDNCLLICVAGMSADGTLSIDSGFTLSSQIGHSAHGFGTLLSYKIQTTAALTNPTVSSDGASGALNVVMASFKAGSSTTDAAINVTEAPDVLAASISIQVAAAIALTEAADVLAATISTQDALAVAINVTEAPDVLAASVATSARTMTIAVTEANDIFAADIVTAAPSGASAWFVNNRRRRR